VDEDRAMASRAVEKPQPAPITQPPKPAVTSRTQPQPESGVAQTPTSRSLSDARRKPAAAPREPLDTAARSVPAPPMSTTTENSSHGLLHRRGKYNIIVNDAMQRDDADEVASRLQKLGYNAYLVP